MHLFPPGKTSAQEKHRELARGQRQLPNLAIRSAFTIILLYGFLTLALITVTELGYLTGSMAVSIGVVFGVLQFVIGPWIMDVSLGWFYSMSWVQPHKLPEHLMAFIQRVCQEQGMKFPRVGIIEDGAPQAFTYGHHPNNARVVLSRGTMKLLNPDELEGVVAHEIGHARNWDMALMTVVNLVPLLFYYLYRGLTRWADRRDKGAPWYIIAGAYLLYVVSEYMVLWFSRTREFYADRFAGNVTRNPNALATALIKIAYGLAAQNTSVEAAGEEKDGLISLNLSGNAPKPLEKVASGKSKKTQKREVMGAGALATLSIFDRNTAVSMVVSSANQFTTGADSGLDPVHVKKAMQWDMWNPWARWYELHSTHPLTARRLEYLSDQAAALGQRPAIVFDSVKPESYWDEFIVDFLLLSAPIVGALVGLAYALWQDGPWQWSRLGLAISLFGMGLLFKNFFRYRRGQFPRRTVADLLGEVKVSPVRPVLATVKGKIVGRGVPGLIFSEDFVLRDETGIIFLDYQQPLAIWNMVFGLLRSGTYHSAEVRATGWFRRAPTPYFEILHLEKLDGKEPRTCYTSYASMALGAILLFGGVVFGMWQ